MIPHQQNEPANLEEVNIKEININPNPAESVKDLGFVAYVIGASVLVGAILISATLFYNFKMVFKRMDAGSTIVAAQNTQAQAAVPSVAPTAAPAAAAPSGPVNITLKPNTPYLGSSNAKVTVVEYADYECPFCEQWFKNVFSDLKSKYIDTGKIKFEYQDFAFLGPDSNTAAEASHCAEDQNKFWQYHDYLFNNQGQEGSGWATALHQKEFAKAVGLNTTQFNSCLDSGKYKQQVLDETAAGKSYGVSGTPSVFVNGTIIVGAQPATSFEQAIDAALKK
jgi:protein-disulfide isomerase